VILLIVHARKRVYIFDIRQNANCKQLETGNELFKLLSSNVQTSRVPSSSIASILTSKVVTTVIRNTAMLRIKQENEHIVAVLEILNINGTRFNVSVTISLPLQQITSITSCCRLRHHVRHSFHGNNANRLL